MTGILYIRDPDPARRAGAAQRAAALLAEMDLAIVADVDCGDHRVVVGSFAGAPVSTAVEGDRCAVIVGDRFDEGRAQPTTADELLSGTVDPKAVADGYHACVVAGPDGAMVQVDPLGYFPIHHADRNDVALAASSPQLLTAHPSATLRLDTEGLARILLTHTGADERTCFAGIARLLPGHRLVVTRGGPSRVERQYRMPTELDAPPAPFEELARRMDDRLVAECRRHLSAFDRHVLLLSGGLDSRHVGAAARRADRRLRAVTFGAPQDFEYEFAGRVASALEIDHELVPDRTDTHTFERLVRWEGLHTTPALEVGGVSDPAGRMLSGLAFDNLIGGWTVDLPYDEATRTIGVEHFLHQACDRGIGVETLRALLRPEAFGAGAADAAADQLRAEFHRSGTDDLSRAWVYFMHHGDRHWVGVELSRHAFEVWPATPHLSRSFLDVAREVPLGYLAGRRLQRDMVRLAHPEMASIPLDAAHFHTTAIVPRTADVLRAAAVRRSIRLRRRLHLPVAEKRYFTRVLDFDQPAWSAARRRHEPARAAAHELFDAAAFNQILPPPDQPVPAGSFPASNGAKMLLAVLALLGDGVAP